MSKYIRWLSLYQIEFNTVLFCEKAIIQANHDGLTFNVCVNITHADSINAFVCKKSLEDYIKEILVESVYDKIRSYEREKYINTLPRAKQKLLRR